MQSSNAAVLQSANLYVYTMNNPVFFTDPSGMIAIPLAPVIAGGAALAAAGALIALDSMMHGQNSMVARAAAGADTLINAIRPVFADAIDAVTPSRGVATRPQAQAQAGTGLTAIGAAGVAQATTYQPSNQAALPLSKRARAVASSAAAAPAITNDDLQLAITSAIGIAGTTNAHGESLRFMAATIPRGAGGVQPGIIPTSLPMTLQDAANYIMSIRSHEWWRGVIAFSHYDAFELVHHHRLGGPIISRAQPENQAGSPPGFFWHYHPRNRANAHIWFPR